MTDQYRKTILRRCNELALRARGKTSTNPNVGAIILNPTTRKIRSEGWHQSFGGPHAEINAIQGIHKKESIKGNTIAVSLEPCNHSGKTPACTRAILENKITQVVIDQVDPDPRMQSQSLELLRKQGVDVSPPLSSPEGDIVLQPFRINLLKKRPYIRLKMAISADRFIGRKNEQVKISNALSNRWVHRIRNETQAIMAGTNTLLNDNPQFTSRYGNEHQPIPILLDRNGVLPSHLRVFHNRTRPIVVTLNKESDYPGTRVYKDPHDLSATFQSLYQHNIGSILIEGGSTFFTSLFKENLWDELMIIQNSTLNLGSGILAPEFPAGESVQDIKLGSDNIRCIKNSKCR
ncbi:bifunctional diaminohydroxyphosphoribosylaminopyrimidine deaminase/5-amino-6-(5-phosphoribosylamino)uracil reductase RibD [Membranicola marinus]|uniref:Riboflavin biosynthesis protein RibD n=1 Tax=Membranihabitans marinus TaxID=1227546 RepID=A0A953HJU8_9BACT|nr:bifunctional diaminohydroxyphosphoribosylaminopyrimidine deaminase/5-amino-6-(5-phosphoribosylamino)uracil reductase RibD [Membranihabitans marinus]MBY5957037.1 bifunctional diaminohydroxyphosphoribosylaminopyrimidine deaminase/5-amino-6-(5-phosphoribosylamino)uracil reductase RibD [Membranihabitans marinus]